MAQNKYMRNGSISFFSSNDPPVADSLLGKRFLFRRIDRVFDRSNLLAWILLARIRKVKAEQAIKCHEGIVRLRWATGKAL
jgi:hypothetical protein